MADIPMPQSDQPTQLPVSPVEQKLHQGVVNFAKAQKLTCRNDLINLLSPCLCLGDGVEVFWGQGVKGEQMSLFSRSTELVWLLKGSVFGCRLRSSYEVRGLDTKGHSIGTRLERASRYHVH